MNTKARERRGPGAADDALPPGRDEAVTVLFHTHWASLVRLARLLVDDVETAEDVVQEAFAQLHRRWGTLRDPERALFYLRAAVANGSRNHLRSRRVRRGHIADAPVPQASAESVAIDRADHRAVLDHLRELPWRQRQVLVLRYYLDLPEAQIADALGISAGAVKSHASRGVATLGRRLEADVMSTTDIPTVLADALHREAAATPVTDSHLAVRRLERTVRAHRQRRLVLALAAAAVTVGVLAAGAALVAAGDDRAEGPPAEKQEQTRELPPPGHRIVFMSREDRLLVVDDRGGTPVPVLDGTQPRFSPEGRRLVFTDRDGVPSVATVGEWRAEPLDDRPLPAGFERVGMVWSPDGTRVAYVEMLDSDFPEGGDLFLVDVASGTAEKVRHFAGPYVKPLEWSPDGSSLLLGFDRSGEGGRMVVDTFDLVTGTLTPLLRGWGETLGVRYSPDGTQIAYYSDSRQCICVAAPDGSGTRVVLQFSGAEPDTARLAWSPDGTKIVWSERFGGRISLLDVDSGVSRKLTTGGGQATEIDWDRP